MGGKTVRYQWVKVIMYNEPPYFVRIANPVFYDTIPWVARCLEDHGISSSDIKLNTLVTRAPGKTPKSRIFYYERPIGLMICDNCGKTVPEDTNICINCGNVFNERLIELNKNGNKKN